MGEVVVRGGRERGVLSVREGRDGRDGADDAPCRPWLRCHSLFACVLFALAVGLLGATSAWAARGLELSGTLGTHCGTKPCGPGELESPSAVAVDEASGDAYVLDEGNARVQRFSSSGTYEGQFNGSGKFEVASDPEPQKEGAAPPTGAFSFSGEAQVSGIAVDNSCSILGLSGAQCESADPSHDDVYVIDSGHEVIDKFNARGEYIGQISAASGEALVTPSGVGADKGGSLWALQLGSTPNGILERFANDEGSSFEFPLELQRPDGAFLSPGLAVNGQGAFYRTSVDTAGHYRAEKLDPSGAVEDEEFGTLSVSGVGADQRSNNAFIDNAISVGVFDSKGTSLGRLTVPAEHGAGVGTDAGQGQEALYVVDKEAGLIDRFTPKPPGPPMVEIQSVSEVSADSASFEGRINPGGAPSTYRFEYGPCETLATCKEGLYPNSVPIPEGQAGEDFNIHAVRDHVQDLSPATSYHFRLSVRNQIGGQQNETFGKEGTFTTQGVGGGLVLADSRHWELVSPSAKFGALIAPIGEIGVVQAAASGDGITYLANAPIEAHPQGLAKGAQILSTRSAGAWRSENLTVPHGAVTGESVGPGHEYRLFSEQLAYSFVQPFGSFTPEISPEASEQSAFRRTVYTGENPATPCEPQLVNCFRPLVTGAPGFANVPAGTVFGQLSVVGGACPTPSIICGPEVEEATPDGNHAVLGSSVALSKTPITEEELYEWDGQAPAAEQLQLISVLPGAGSQPAVKPKLGFRTDNTRGALSDDGSRVVFEAQSPEALYMRETLKGQTIELDKAEGKCEAEGQCQSGGGRFQLAGTDGSRVLFTDSHRLSADAGSGGEDLYECQIISGSGGEDECELTDLTPETGGESADVLGTLPGASADGQWVYFVANGVLTSQADSAGEKASPGGCTTGTTPPGATCNLYVHHGGQTRLVAVLGSGDLHDWSQELFGMPARVSPNGQWLAFMSERSLTGYDNSDATSGRPDAEVYLYGAVNNDLVCASCLPSGARPSGVEYKKLEPNHGGLVGGPEGTWQASALVAANVPGWTANGDTGKLVRHQPRYLTDQGRLFFNSADDLVPQDVNSTEDVYQYEPPGVGSCATTSASFSVRSGGCVDLISSGESSEESAFLDASESGNDVFFLTAGALLPQEDHDSAFDVYDAHVCSTDSPCSSEGAEESPPCDTGDSCKAPPSPQPEIFGSPASSQFSGPGNPVPPGEVKPKPPTRAELLAKALKSCRKRFSHAKKRRQACERQARSRYGPKKKAKKAGAKKVAKAKAKKGARR